MALVTTLELQKRFTSEELLDVAGDNDGALDQARVDRAINDASSEVEGYLVGRYALPLAIVPEIIERITCDLAWYYLHSELIPEPVAKRYERAVAMLKSMAKGEIGLGPALQGGAPVTQDGAELNSAPTMWNRQRSSGFI